jgi:hypothetical protein
MAKRLSTNLGEKVIVEQTKFVSESRKQFFLSQRQEAKLYKVNRSFLWAKSFGAQTAVTNNLVNLSYGFLQGLNDISAFFVTDNLTKSLAARYAWTKGGKFLAGIQNKVVPSGYGPVSRALRVQAGRQSKNILSKMSSKFFVNSELTIHNVKNFEDEIKRQIRDGRGIGRQWSLMTAANAISGAPDPYHQAAKLMGGYGKRNMTSDTDFASNQFFLKNTDMFKNLMSEGMNVSEANHYLKFMKTGANPNNLLDDYRQAIARKNPNPRHYVKDIRTGEMSDDLEGLIDEIEDSVKPSKEKLASSYQKRRKDGDYEIMGREYLGMDPETGEPRYRDSKTYPSFGFNIGENSTDATFFRQFSGSEVDDMIERMIGKTSGSLTKYGDDLENYSSKFEILYDTARKLNHIARARSKNTAPLMPKGKLNMARRYAQARRRGGDIKDDGVRQAVQFLNMTSMGIHGAHRPGGDAGGTRRDAERLVEMVLGAEKGLGDFQEMSVMVGGGFGRTDTKGFNSTYANVILQNNPAKANYIPSRQQIQKAIHIIPPEDMPKDNVFLSFGVSFGGSTPRSQFADSIVDAQQIEYGGPATTTQTPYAYPRTLFLNNAAYKTAQSLGINATFRFGGMQKGHFTQSLTNQTLRGISPREKDRGFNLLADYRLKTIMNAENAIYQDRLKSGRVKSINPRATVFDDPLRKQMDAVEQARASINNTEAFNKLQGIGSTAFMVDVLEDGTEVVRKQKLEPVSDLSSPNLGKTPQERFLESTRRDGRRRAGVNDERSYINAARIQDRLMNILRKEINFQEGPFRTSRYKGIPGTEGSGASMFDPKDYEWIYTTRIPRGMVDDGLTSEQSIIDYIDTIYQKDRDMAISNYRKDLLLRSPGTQELREIATAEVNATGNYNPIDAEAKVQELLERKELEQGYIIDAEVMRYEDEWDANADRHFEDTLDRTVDQIGQYLLDISKSTSDEAMSFYNSGLGKFEKAPSFKEIESDIQSTFESAQKEYIDSRIAKGDNLNQILSSKEFKEFLAIQRDIMKNTYSEYGIEFTTSEGGRKVIAVFPGRDDEQDLIITLEQYIRDDADRKFDAPSNYDADYIERVRLDSDPDNVGELYIEGYDGKAIPGDFRDTGVQGDPVFEDFLRGGSTDKNFVENFMIVLRELRISDSGKRSKGWSVKEIYGDYVVVDSNEGQKQKDFTTSGPLGKALENIAADINQGENTDTLALLLFGYGDELFNTTFKVIMETSSQAGSDQRIFSEVSSRRRVLELLNRLQSSGDLVKKKRAVKDFYNSMGYRY